MIGRIKSLIGYSIKGLDGSIACLKDILFDEKEWAIRYLEADFGSSSKEKKVLIPQFFLREINWDNNYLVVDLVKQNIEACPEMGGKKHVSKKYEKSLCKYYGIEYYWHQYNSALALLEYNWSRPLNLTNNNKDKTILDTRLHSFLKIKGYKMKTIDGVVGHIDDFLIDDTWKIVFVIVDISPLISVKRIMVSIDWLEDVSFSDQEVLIGISSKAIKKLPGFESFIPEDNDYKKSIFDSYYNEFMKF